MTVSIDYDRQLKGFVWKLSTLGGEIKYFAWSVKLMIIRNISTYPLFR